MTGSRNYDIARDKRDPSAVRDGLMLDFARRMLPADEYLDLAEMRLADDADARGEPDEADAIRVRARQNTIQRALSRGRYKKADDHVVSLLKGIAFYLNAPDADAQLAKLFAQRAKIKSVQDFVAAGDRRGLSDAVWRGLTDACAAFRMARGKLKETDREQSRLGENMMAVVYGDGRIVMVTSLLPEGDPGIEVLPMGVGDNYRPLLDLIASPPSCPFIVMPFGKAPLKLADLVVNIPGQDLDGLGRIFLPGGITIDRGAIKSLLALYDGAGNSLKDAGKFLGAIKAIASILAVFPGQSENETRAMVKRLDTEMGKIGATADEISLLVRRLPSQTAAMKYGWSVIGAALSDHIGGDADEGEEA